MMNFGEAAAAGLGILIFLAVRAFIFHTDLRGLVLSLTVTRDADKTILHQSSIVNISSSMTAVTKHLTASFEDILPTGSVLTAGSPRFTEGRASYSFNLPVIGDSFFQGVRITCSDLFFAGTLLVARNADLPKLTMYPTGISATHHAVGHGAGWSAQEYDRPALIAGFDTRTLRPYADGDSMRDLDWKLSGKHQELYVRLRMDASGGLPALLIDLPQRGASEELCLHFAETVVGVLESLNIGEEYPVIFISGAMYLDTIRSGQSDKIIAYLKEAGTIYAPEYLYRLRHPSVIRRSTESGHQITDAERRIEGLIRLYAGRYPTDFERTVRNISSSLEKETHITYVTAAHGDLSHMTYLINETKKNARYAAVFVVGAADTPREAEIRNAFTLAGADVVEMI
jgi:hypothetical protein